MRRQWWRYFFFQAEDGIRGLYVTGVQTCALPICAPERRRGVGDAVGDGAERGDGERAVGDRGLVDRPQDRARQRSEERRVGKECRSRWSPEHGKKKRTCAITPKTDEFDRSE